MNGDDASHNAPDTVSVIIPCFNAERYVGEAIESVLAQILPGDEIIVVDDGSSDDSAEVIAGFGARVRYIHQPNQGISAARNSGLARAAGACMAFLDADDLWTPDSLAIRRGCLAAAPDLDYVYGWVEPFISPDMDAEARKTVGALPAVQPGRVAGTMLVRRRVFESVGAFDGNFKIGETMDWVARVDAAGHRSRDTGTVVLRRRIHGANTVIKQRKMQSDYLRVLRAAIERRRGTAGE
jgi:glycosyltransferase involved in cell wall biosynthesis